jgi:hypothetical protein
MSQERARTRLIGELAGYDLSPTEKCQILAGTRLLADVLGEHDKRISASQREDQ